MTYVTGAHNLKGGFQLRSGFFQESFTMNGDMVLILNNGVPNSVRLLQHAARAPRGPLGQLGIYLQDSWTLKRLTINPGVRFEHVVMNIPAQGAPGGTWVGARQFERDRGSRAVEHACRRGSACPTI